MEEWITKIIRELENEGFDDDMDTFKNWLVYCAIIEDSASDCSVEIQASYLESGGKKHEES